MASIDNSMASISSSTLWAAVSMASTADALLSVSRKSIARLIYTLMSLDASY